MTNEYPRLCGGTFFTLLLQAIKQRTKARQRIAGERDGLSETDLLIGLIRVAYPEYKVTNNASFKTNTSDYKKCKVSTSSYLPFDWPAVIEGFDRKVTSDYQTPLHAMSVFVNNFIEVGTSAGKDMRLVKTLLELVREDTTLDNDHFYCCERGQPIMKSELITLSEICLPALLLGIWHFIFVNRRDNTVGAATFNAWHSTPSIKRAKKDFIGFTGASINHAIKIHDIGEPEKDEQSAANATVQSNVETKQQPEPKSLLDLLEDAIDQFDIAEFVDSDYTVELLKMDLVIAVDSFVSTMRCHLKSFRRRQDDVFKNVILFVNEINQYSSFLSMKMSCDDGRYNKWRCNTSEDVETAFKYRNKINLLYGLISGGRTLSVYGYSTPANDDEAERNETNNSTAEKISASITQAVNIQNYLMQQNTLQIENHEISREYYNLFVISDEIKNWRFTMPKDRSLRSNSDIVKKFADLTSEVIDQIKTFPSLFMYENTEYGGRTSPDQKAYFGFVTDLRVQENGLIKVRFRRDADINQQQINDIAHLLDIHEGSGIMELNHTHWTIKNVDLIEELTEAELLPQEEFSLRRLP